MSRLSGALRLMRLVTAMLLLWLSVISEATAHAQLVRSDPADGSMISRDIGTIELVFNEPVAPLLLKIVDPMGTVRIVTGQGEGNRLSIVPPAGMDGGTRLVSYRVMSSDGHPVGGSLTYSVGHATAVTSDMAEGMEPSLAVFLVTMRAVSLIVLAIIVGGAAFRAFLWPEDRWSHPRLIGLGGLPLLGWLLATGADMGPGWNGILAPGTARLALSSPSGWTILAYGVVILLAVESSGRQGRVSRCLTGLALVALAAGLALSGHAASAEPQSVMRPLIALHGVLAMLWLGALIPLLRASRQPPREAAAIFARFSRLAIPGVILVLASGAVLAMVQVETPQALIETTYGRLLVVKLALVAGLSLIAILNRLVLTPRLERGAPGPVRRALAVDLVLAAVLLAVVAGWRITPPPRALHQRDAAGVSVHFHALEAMADVTVRPARRGDNAVEFGLMTGEFGALDPKEVTVRLVDPLARFEPVERKAVKGKDARWRVNALPLPVSGRMTLRLDILVDDFTKVGIGGEFEVGQ
jgi:copper transport protein